MTESGLKLLLEKQQSLLKELLDFSQRQFAETDSVSLDNLLSQKDKCFEELQKVDSLVAPGFYGFHPGSTGVPPGFHPGSTGVPPGCSGDGLASTGEGLGGIW